MVKDVLYSFVKPKKVIVQRFEIELSSDKPVNGKDADDVLDSLDSLNLREEIEKYVKSLLSKHPTTADLSVIVSE